ncbi:hypothetical protein ABW21_db0209545 [Orbilia brochopaga]|nr:hypothetical protein ABW21_db0209545 [Drechslerella brochopaga]
MKPCDERCWNIMHHLCGSIDLPAGSATAITSKYFPPTAFGLAMVTRKSPATGGPGWPCSWPIQAKMRNGRVPGADLSGNRIGDLRTSMHIASRGPSRDPGRVSKSASQGQTSPHSGSSVVFETNSSFLCRTRVTQSLTSEKQKLKFAKRAQYTKPC